MLPIFGALIIMAFINNLIGNFISHSSISFLSIIQVVTIIGYVFTMIGVVVLFMVVMIRSFYINLLGNEGYFTMSIPVKPVWHIVSKLTTAFIWSIAIILVEALSFVIFIGFDNAATGVKMAIDALSGQDLPYLDLSITAMIVSVLISIVVSTLMIYFAIAIGHLASKHKGLLSIGAYFVIYTVYEVVLVGFVFIAIGAAGLSTAIPTPNDILRYVAILLSLALAASCVFGVAFFLGTNHIIKKRINLD